MVTRRRPMPDEVRARIDELVGTASNRRGGEADGAWSALEDGHVLSQPWAWTHVRVHWAMLTLAWRQRDGREAFGQFGRLLVAAPGSLTGRHPTGNTGRARVSAFEPMPIQDDLASLLADDESERRPDRISARLDRDGAGRQPADGLHDEPEP